MRQILCLNLTFATLKNSLFVILKYSVYVALKSSVSATLYNSIFVTLMYFLLAIQISLFVLFYFFCVCVWLFFFIIMLLGFLKLLLEKFFLDHFSGLAFGLLYHVSKMHLQQSIFINFLNGLNDVFKKILSNYGVFIYEGLTFFHNFFI